MIGCELGGKRQVIRSPMCDIATTAPKPNPPRRDLDDVLEVAHPAAAIGAREPN